MTTKSYDKQIKNAQRLYLPGVDWRLLKAQLNQESLLDSTAISSAGAQGIAQFMPATWREVSKEMDFPEFATPFNSLYAIKASAYYMQKLCLGWTAEREEADRYCLALASYNAGFSNMLKAQKAAGMASDYNSIIKALPHVTNEHAKETIQYVEKIFEYWGNYLINNE